MKKKYFTFLLSAGLGFLLISGNIQAQLRLPSVFSDNMVLQQQKDNPIWGWADPGSMVRVMPSWNNRIVEAQTDKSGNWAATLAVPSAGGPFTITVSDGKDKLVLENVLLGEVWLCAGQSNMEMPLQGYTGEPVLGSNRDILMSANKNIRFISVPRNGKAEPQEDFQGTWRIASPVTVAEFSATAYYFGRMLEELLGVPVGLIDVSYGGSCIQAWMSRETAVPFEDKGIPASDEEISVPNRTPSALFNGMLNPVIGFGIRGAIWYQGETNYQEPDLYEKLFPAMVSEWRALWNSSDFPFYYAQIAPFDYYSRYKNAKTVEKHNSAYLRDAQRNAMSVIPNSGMAVLLDKGEKDCIHPADKKTVGERLTLWALGETYGIKGFGYRSPEYKSIEIKDNRVTVSFDHAENGLTSFGRELSNFEVAGENRIFYPAMAELNRKSIILYSDSVNNPVAVRYGFRDFVIGDLFGTNGLPVSSFRTDKW